MDHQYDNVSFHQAIPANVTRQELSAKNHKTELQWHREPEIVYVCEGRAECSCNGGQQVLEPGGFVLFNSEDVHLVRPAGTQPCQLLYINFSVEYLRLFFRPADNLYFSLNGDPAARAALGEALRQLADTDENSEYAALMQISLLNRIYYLLLKHFMGARRTEGTDRVARRDFSYAKTAIAYINENYRREISLEEIAGVVNLSPSYFSKYFKSVTQVSFSEYLANLRLGNAVNDMLTHNATVSGAASDNGFANVKSFITQCKKVYHCTPAQYKKRLLAQQ